MKAMIQRHNGVPTLFLNDQPVIANCHLIGGLDPNAIDVIQESVRAFARNNIHIYSIDAVGSEWTTPRSGDDYTFDFTETAPRLQAIVDADPDALFLLRMGFETYYFDWWRQAYPDEVEVLTDGPSTSASYASPVWQKQVKDLLRGYIAHLKEAGLYDRVIAYQVATGTCGEWIKSWSSMDPGCGDFSAPMQRAFQQWLRRRYADDVTALRTAWADDAITFENATVPATAQQMQTTHCFFRDPRREQQVIDFYDCYAKMTADAMIGFCEVIKQETGGEKLAGAFFGYIMEISWNNSFFNNNYGDLAASEVSTTQRSGHLGLWKALRSPHVDFFVSPYTYAFRGVGGDGLPMQPTESLRLHNKLYFFEEDTLMHNNFDPGGRMHPVEHSIAIYQRNFAQCITHGLGITWLENNIFVESPLIIDEARQWYKRFDELGHWALHLDRTPSAEVAVILDDESFMYEANRNNIDIPLIWHQRVITLNRFGAPHDLYLLNDLLEGSLPEYKLYVFLNPFHLNVRRRKALKEIVCRDNKVALWLYAAGYINADDPDAPIHTNHMTDLTGFRFGEGRSYYGPFMHLTNFNHPITHGLSQELFWGSTRAIAPNFHLEDPDATTLGEIVYTLGRCRPGFGIKRFHTADPKVAWHSVYCATPNLPAPVLRGIARFAGVHLYNEQGDVLYATPDLLAVHTVAGGPRTYQLPRPAEVVYDLYNDCVLARNTGQFEVKLPPASTALYYTGAAEGLHALPQKSWR
ncbi:MAG: beta-galactosidase [Caldilineaceae bacterium]